MSKTKQRKYSAYVMGYQIGRYGWPDGVKKVSVSKVADGHWHKGISDGARDRVAAERASERASETKVAWYNRLLIWLSAKVAA